MTPKLKRFLQYVEAGKFTSIDNARIYFGLKSSNAVAKWIERLEKQGYRFKKIYIITRTPNA